MSYAVFNPFKDASARDIIRRGAIDIQRETCEATVDWLDDPEVRVIDEFRMVECSIMPDGSIGVGGHVLKETIR